MSKPKVTLRWEEYAAMVQRSYGKPLTFAQLLLVFDSYNGIKIGQVRP